MIGKIVSTKMHKTAVVMVERTKTHPVYKKTFLHSKRYLADAAIGVKDGDVVEIVKVRPISKNKHWKINKVLGRDIVMIVEEELKEGAAEAIAEVMPEEEKEESLVVSHQTEETKEEKPKAKKSRKGQSES